MNFQTDSIKSLIKNSSPEEITKTKKLIINKFSITKEVLTVKYEELLSFPNLETLYLENCILDFLAMSVLTKINNLKSLYLINCEITDENSKLLENLTLNTIVIDNTSLNFKNISILKAKNITLANIEMPNIKIATNNLNISKAFVKNIDFLKNTTTEKMTISYQTYKTNENIFNSLPYKIIVLEKNNNFIYKEVS